MSGTEERKVAESEAIEILSSFDGDGFVTSKKKTAMTMMKTTRTREFEVTEENQKVDSAEMEVACILRTEKDSEL